MSCGGTHYKRGKGGVRKATVRKKKKRTAKKR